jgi:hypothetical protein
MVNFKRFLHGEISAHVGQSAQGNESLIDKPLRAYIFSKQKNYNLKIGDFSLSELDEIIQEMGKDSPNLAILLKVRNVLASTVH